MAKRKAFSLFNGTAIHAERWRVDNIRYAGPMRFGTLSVLRDGDSLLFVDVENSEVIKMPGLELIKVASLLMGAPDAS